MDSRICGLPGLKSETRGTQIHGEDGRELRFAEEQDSLSLSTAEEASSRALF